MKSIAFKLVEEKNRCVPLMASLLSDFEVFSEITLSDCYSLFEPEIILPSWFFLKEGSFKVLGFQRLSLLGLPCYTPVI